MRSITQQKIIALTNQYPGFDYSADGVYWNRNDRKLQINFNVNLSNDDYYFKPNGTSACFHKSMAPAISVSSKEQ